MAEEYCWATTQAAQCLRCGRSGSGTFKSLYFIWTAFNIHTVDSMYIQLWLKARLPEPNYRPSRGVSVFEHNGHHYRLAELYHDFEINTNFNLVLRCMAIYLYTFQNATELKFERSKNCDDFPNGEIRLSDLDIQQLGRNKLAVSGTLGIREPLSEHFKVRKQTNLTAVSINFKAFTASFARMSGSWVLTQCITVCPGVSDGRAASIFKCLR